MSEQNIEIDEKVIKRLENKIIIQESYNLRTKELSDSQMIAKIKKMIEEEVQCYLNQ